MRRRNTQMKLKVLSSLLLGCLLVMITALRNSYARVLPDHEGNNNKLEVSGITKMHAQKEPFERNEIACMRKLWLGGGKKHTTHTEETSMDSENGIGGANNGGTPPKISGKEEHGLQKSFRSLGEQKNDQNKHKKVEPKASKFTNFVRSSPTNTNTKCSQDCNDVPAKASLKSSSRHDEQQISGEPQEGTTAQKEDENQNLVEPAKEIANLFYRDYKGKPSHKPPINNHEPGN